MADDIDPVPAALLRPDAAGRELVTGLVALGLYDVARREWVAGQASADLTAYAATWTPSRIEGLREQATALLDADAMAWAAARREDRGEAVFRNTLLGVVCGGVALAALGAVVLFGLRLAGYDVIAAVERACLPPPSPHYVGQGP